MSGTAHPPSPTSPNLGRVVLWFFALAGVVHLALVSFTTVAGAQVEFQAGRLDVSGYVWLLLGCLALALAFALPGPRPR